MENRINLYDYFQGIHYSASAYDNRNKKYEAIIGDCDKAIFHVKQDEIIIAVCGSNDLFDWVNNFRFIGTSSKLFGRMPSGFIENVMKLFKNLNPKISNHKQKPIKIYAHSRGVPLAMALGIILKAYNYNVVRMWGYGSPNIGKQSTIDRILKVCDDIVLFDNEKGFFAKLVRRVPPSIFGYKKPVEITICTKEKGHSLEVFLKNKPINYI